MMGEIIDNAFVDGIKSATGLEISIFGQDLLSATTFITGDGKTRATGLKVEGKRVFEEVLLRGRSYSGTVKIQNTTYLSAVNPLNDQYGAHIGMLFVGTPESEIFKRSIELTFIMSALLLIFAIVPAYLLSKYLAYQLH